MKSKSALPPSAPMTAVSRPWAFGRFCRIAAPAPSPNKHAGVAIRPIDDGRKFFGADDQHGFVGARHDELLADFERVNKSGTRRFEIKRRGALRADLVLHEAGRGREGHVRRDGGDDD